jgi:hypothetical protein
MGRRVDTDGPRLRIRHKLRLWELECARKAAPGWERSERERGVPNIYVEDPLGR